MPKRKRVSTKRAVRTSMRVGNWASLARASRARKRPRSTRAYMTQRLASAITQLNRTIEMKEGQQVVSNLQIPHNNLVLLSMNPFTLTNGATDPMVQNSGQRIGDRITVHSLTIKGMVEASLQRSKVHFRILLLRAAKGDTFNRQDIFQGKSGNKMLDYINTERYTVLAQKSFNVVPPNNVVSTFNNVTGLPTTAMASGITGNRIFTITVPGYKFGRGGHVTYENLSSTQVKFFDYRIVVLAYDWFGTPQDTNNVGFINEIFTVLRFKDA